MAFNGSGTFVRLYDWEQDLADGIDINATRMDNEFDGIATGLTLCFLRDGSVAMAGNLDLGSHSVTNIADGSAGTPALKFNSAAGIYYSAGLGFSVGGAAVATLDASSFDSLSMVRAKGLTLPTTGAGVELGYASNIGYLGSIDRSTSTYKELNLRGSSVKMAPSGTTIFAADPTGIIINPGGSTVMAITALGVTVTGILTVGGNSVITTASSNILPITAIANQAQATVLGRASGAGTGAVTALTQAQLTALINPATAALSGAAPAFPNNTTTFLRGDGSYAAPPGAAWTLLSTQTPSGSTSTTDVDVSSYTDIFIDCAGISSSAGSPSLSLERQGAGTPFATVSAATSSASTINVSMQFTRSPIGTVLGIYHDGTAGGFINTTAAVTSFHVRWSSGNFDAGTIKIYGRV